MQSETVANTAVLANQVALPLNTNRDSRSVLLVGASVRWAAQSAQAGGYRVIAMDLFGDLDTRAASARCEIISPAEQADPDKLDETVSRIAHEERAAVVRVGGLRSANYTFEDSAGLRHERLMELARSEGFHSPETASLIDRRVATTARWLVKEANSTGGLGVRFQDQCRNRPIVADTIRQRWIPGRSLGLVALADNGCVSLLGMTRSIFHRCGDLPFVYAGSRTLAHDEAIPWSSMQTLCERIADARRLQGLFNLDWIHDRENQWWLLEINERPSASCEVIERALQASGVPPVDASLMRLHLAALLPDHVASTQRPPHATQSADGLSRLRQIRCAAEHGRRDSSTHVKRIVYSRRDGRVQLSALAGRWRNSLTVSSDAGAFSGWQLADIPADGTPMQRGQPIATLLLDSRSRGTPCAPTLREAIRQVHNVVS